MLALLLVAGCGASAGAGGADRPCTEIGASTGIAVDIAPRPAGPEAVTATVEACWGRTCRTAPVELSLSTTAGPPTCTGNGQDDSCSAAMRYTGGKNGFAYIDDLPEQPVAVTLTVSGDGGTEIVRQELDITAQPVYPNGPHCGAAGPQARLHVDAAGNVRAR
ncbi:hypothetical protein ABZ863_21705 [Saccharomonospora sp. NPDC046836]|uniref:hypothetical protein n=1 Tax=Saccharomonospora sp. NPDC046836 TaxID=3156921 RepID=UPI0033CFB20F